MSTNCCSWTFRVLSLSFLYQKKHFLSICFRSQLFLSEFLPHFQMFEIKNVLLSVQPLTHCILFLKPPNYFSYTPFLSPSFCFTELVLESRYSFLESWIPFPQRLYQFIAIFFLCFCFQSEDSWFAGLTSTLFHLNLFHFDLTWVHNLSSNFNTTLAFYSYSPCGFNN